MQWGHLNTEGGGSPPRHRALGAVLKVDPGNFAMGEVQGGWRSRPAPTTWGDVQGTSNVKEGAPDRASGQGPGSGLRQRPGSGLA